MVTPKDNPQSFATISSWVSLGLALGCAAVFLMFVELDKISPFEHTKQGVLTGLIPRTLLYGVWMGEALAVVTGLGSFLLIRRTDIVSKAVTTIVVRSLIGITIGLIGVLVLWLYVGHRVIGF